MLYYKKLPPNIPDCFVMLVTYYIRSLLTGRDLTLSICHSVPREILTNTIPRDDICRYCLQRQTSCTNHKIEVNSFLRGQHENMNHSYKFQIMAPSNGYCYCTPKNCSDVVQVDPMLATAGSALRAIRVLQVTLSNCYYCHCNLFSIARIFQDSGVSTSRILFLNLVCAPEGLKAMAEAYPEIEVCQ